jgi:hypothetical protein
VRLNIDGGRQQLGREFGDGRAAVTSLSDRYLAAPLDQVEHVSARVIPNDIAEQSTEGRMSSPTAASLSVRASSQSTETHLAPERR